MKVATFTTEEFINSEDKGFKEMAEVKIKNGDEVFTISEHEGKIQVRVNGRLWIEPKSNNSIIIEEGKL